MKWLVLGACTIAFVSGAALYDAALYDAALYDEPYAPNYEYDDDIAYDSFRDPWANSYDAEFDFHCPKGRHF